MRKLAETFPHKLKMLRVAEGLTQEELAKELCISRSCLANYESGAREPDQEMLSRIADRFNVLTDYLMCRTDFCSLPIERDKVEEFCEISARIKRHGDTIDISGISMKKKIAILEFCRFIISTDEMGDKLSL